MGGVTLDFTKAKPIASQGGGVSLDFSKAKPISPISPSPAPQEGFFHSLGEQLGLTPEAAQQSHDEFMAHPITNLIEAGTGITPIKTLAQGILGQVKNTYSSGKSAIHDYRSGNTPQAVVDAVQALPIIGQPMVKAAQQATNNPTPPPSTGNTYSDDLRTAMSTPGAMGTLLGMSAQLAPMVTDAALPARPAPTAAPTPQQLAAHTGLLGRMNGLGDNFIPQDSAATTSSVARQAAADNPTIAKVATMRGSSPDNIAAYQAILQKANSALEVPHANTIAIHAPDAADVRGIQAAVGQSFPKTLAGVSPEDAAAIQQLQSRLGTINTLGGLNDLRQWLNDEAAAGYKQDGVAAARGTATKAGIRTAADAARNAYYDQLQQASGTDFRPLKAQQSALLDQQEGAAKLGQTLSAQQAIANEPKSPGARIGEVLTGGRALKAGPIAGAAQLAAEKLLRQTPLTQPNYLIRKFLSDLPEPTPQSPQVAAPVPSNAPQLPANASPQNLNPQPPAPGPSPQPLLGNPQGQLPATAVQALLEQSAQPLALPADTNAMNVSQSPSTQYPPLNADTARTRIAPTQYAAPPPVASTGARPVTPSGQVLTPLQRFLQAGDLGNSIVEPSTDDLKRAIQNMRKRRGK